MVEQVRVRVRRKDRRGLGRTRSPRRAGLSGLKTSAEARGWARGPAPGAGRLDVIAVNLDHYRLDAAFKHGMHFTALPTAWVSGFDKEDSLRIGSSTAWTTETVGASAGFLECQFAVKTRQGFAGENHPPLR
jgi:hypothetical protein